jgi:hypothetical protein
MDLYKEWDTLNKTKFNTTLTNPEIMEALTQQSNSTLAELKTRLKQKIYWTLSFATIDAIWLLCSLKRHELLLILSCSLSIKIIFLIVTVSNYKKLQKDDILSENVTRTIKKNYAILKNTLAFEMVWGLLSIPIGILTASLIVNYYFGHTISDYFNNAHRLTSLLIGFIVLVPLAMIGASKANQKAFGGHLDQLQKNMIQLETLEDKDSRLA